MYVVIAGAGHMGTHLAVRLVAEGHETVVIDVDPAAAQRLYTEHGVVSLSGSGTDMALLEQAGIKRADAAVAMTGRDAENLAFCLLARFFGVPRVLARMLDPRYETPYRLVGATKVHSEADILVNSFLTSIEFPELGGLMSVGRGDLVAFELRIPPGSAVAGQSISELVRRSDFPERCVFVGVESASGEMQAPRGDTLIEAGAHVMLAAHRPDLPRLLATLRAPRAQAAVGGDVLATLRQVGFLRGLADEDLEGLSAGARVETRRAGEALYRLGEPGDRLYVVRKGRVELLDAAGHRELLEPPAHFGELSALIGEPRRQTARVLEDAELLVVDSAAFRGVLVRNPFLALELAKELDAKV